jgi:hypothetical protein
MIQKKSLFTAALLGLAALGQQKPNFTGTWELSKIDRDGNTITPGTRFKETQVWVHRDQKLTITMRGWDDTRGYWTVELSYTIDGKAGPVGYATGRDGKKSPISGSARWEGNRLVYEQDHDTGHSPSRIIRSCTFDPNGPKIVSDSLTWLAGKEQPYRDKWTWEKKNDTP